MQIPLGIASVGVFSPGGITVGQTLGSFLAGMRPFQEIDVDDPAGEPLVAAATALEPERLRGTERLIAMAMAALLDCTEGAADPDGASARVPEPLLLCGPDAQCTDAVLSALLHDMPLRLDESRSRAFVGGHCTILAALEEALRLVSSGEIETCYVGGVDSLLDGERLQMLIGDRRVKHSAHQDGFVPGEGAAFLRVVSHVDARAAVVIPGLATGQESATRDSGLPNNGQGLFSAARAALKAAGLSIKSVELLSFDGSGDRFGAQEANRALVRLRPRREQQLQIWQIAGALGELGTAHGPASLALLAFAIARSVLPVTRGLALWSSDGAQRAAALVARNPRHQA